MFFGTILRKYNTKTRGKITQNSGFFILDFFLVMIINMGPAMVSAPPKSW